MPTERIVLAGSLTNRKLNAAVGDTNDQRFQNCFPEIVANPVTGKKTVYLNKRQGTAASAVVQASATGRFGGIIWTSKITAGNGIDAPVVLPYLKSTGSSVMFFDAESRAQIGGDVANTTTCHYMGESDVGGTANLTAVLDDSATAAREAWFYPDAGAWTQITDGDFPADIQPVHAHMDGYMFVMTYTGRIYNSDLNSLSSWAANNYITAGAFGDKGSGVVRYKNFIVGFGDYSTEFFVNAGNSTGSVLTRISDATISIGALRNAQGNAPGIRPIGDTVYWVGETATGGRGVFRLNGMKAEKVSTPAIDKLIGAGAIRGILGCITLMGMTHVGFWSITATTLFCYCVDSNFWWVFVPGGGLTIRSMVTGVTTGSIAKSYLSVADNAQVYSMDPSSPVWQDNAIAYTMLLRTQNMDMGTRRTKFWKSLSLIGDIESSTSDVAVSSSDDDYAAFGNSQTIDISKVRDNRLTRLGASRRRAWQLSHTANTPCRLEAMDIEYDLGAH